MTKRILTIILLITSLSVSNQFRCIKGLSPIISDKYRIIERVTPTPQPVRNSPYVYIGKKER